MLSSQIVWKKAQRALCQAPYSVLVWTLHPSTGLPYQS
jgi:hypothetical protein